TNPAERIARSPRSRHRQEDKAATEEWGGQARIGVQRALEPVAWRGRRWSAGTAYAGPLRPPGIHSLLSHLVPPVPPTPAARARAISSHENEPGRRCH